MSALRKLTFPTEWPAGWWTLDARPLTCCAPGGPKGRTHVIARGDPIYVTGHGAGEVYCERHARSHGNAPPLPGGPRHG